MNWSHHTRVSDSIAIEAYVHTRPDGSRAGSGHRYRVVDLRDGSRGAPQARLADARRTAEALREALGEGRR